MGLRLIAMLSACATMSCAATEAVSSLFEEKPPDPIVLPQPKPPGDITGRVFVIGDAGLANFTHDAAINAMAGILAKGGSVPSFLLIPGGVNYPSGLPDHCADALETLKTEYLKKVPGSVQIYAVPGNADHAAMEKGTAFEVAWRAAYFDCDHQSAVADRVGWEPKECACDKRWHVPSGAGPIGTHVLIPSRPNHTGFGLVTYDSQAALDDPNGVAILLQLILDSAPPNMRYIVMAAHPLLSVGPHGRSSFNPQDAGSAKYQAYIARFQDLFGTRADRVALTVFGHDHSVQYFPRSPAELISGAGAMKTSVSSVPDGAFAVGGEPGIASLDLHAGGGVTVHLLTQEEPREFEISPVP